MNDHIMDTIRATFSQNPTRAAAIVSSTAVLGISIPWFISNFRAFKALGPGGIPYNFRGWLLALFYKPFCLETKGTSVYDLDANKETWLDANVIPERRGARPSISWHPIPHRQLDKIPSVDIQQVCCVSVGYERMLKIFVSFYFLYEAPGTNFQRSSHRQPWFSGDGDFPARARQRRPRYPPLRTFASRSRR